MSADLNKFTLVKKDGKISPSLSSQKWFEEAGTGGRVDREDLANILNAFIRSPRGELFIEKQSSPDGLRWCALVPLILATFKEYRNIGYNEWDYTDPKMVHFLDKDIQDLLPYIKGDLTVEAYTLETLLQFITTTSTVRSGKTAGLIKPITSITSVTKVPELKEYPRLLKLILLQAWVCHPTLRHPLMLLDINDLDNMPTPLVSTEVFPTTEVKEDKPFQW